MEKYPIHQSGKEAYYAGDLIFTSVKPCKHNHIPSIRKIVLNKPDIITSRCMTCLNETRNKYADAPDGPQKIKKAKTEYKARNKHTANLWREKLRVTDPYRQQLISIKIRCMKNNIPFDLDTAYMHSIEPENMICPITGWIMVRGINGSDRRNWISVDRLIPSKGYVKGNVALISNYANLLKRDCIDLSFFTNIITYIQTNTDAEELMINNNIIKKDNAELYSKKTL
jgi:hypothetical protein